ncbi:MAG: 6-carboxytetrahydropterin synthase, partial [Phycisphaerales bacterium]|nr:6-carboxytetrahydropterin synthase [Phycisphaerales bacterium]
EITGYILNIKAIDHAVRDHVVAEARASMGTTDLVGLIGRLHAIVARELPCEVSFVRLQLSPYHSIERSDMALLRTKLDFAASHRLHVPTLSDEENRRLFGKCNYPSGHGHNYQVEPCVILDEGARFGVPELERLADEHVIEPFDHRHLNVDIEEFRTLNPTVELIAKVCYDRLKPHIDRDGVRLRDVTVWESDRTCATYPSGQA